MILSVYIIHQTNYTYTGREWDKETGLYYYKARYYDPMDGKFISKDPIGFAGGDANLYAYVDSVGKPPVPQTNLYQYTHNNPINFTDPLGLFDWGFGGQLGVVTVDTDSSSNFTKTNVGVASNFAAGAGIKLCFDHPFKDTCNPPKLPFGLNVDVGLAKWLSISTNETGYCINIGVTTPGAPIPAFLSKNLFSF